ncbi:MAG: CsbD family protein [Actinomycetota bacterium]|nr:CsbD family protein [Actinomycetota bacterium]
MGLLSDLRHSITRLWGRTEQVVGEAYGNEALEYEGAADEARAAAEEAAEEAQDDDEPGTAAAPAR